MVDLVLHVHLIRLILIYLPTFDVEYLFLKMRGKSVGETMNINVICPDDEITTQVQVQIKFR